MTGPDPPGLTLESEAAVQKRTFLGLALAAPLVTIPFLTSTPALAADGGAFQATLAPVPTNHVDGSGSAMVAFTGPSTVRVTVDANQLLDSSPHAQHIHFGVEAQHECPTSAVAKLHNGHRSITTSDGAAAYGPITTSLTTRGDTSPKSGLAVKRFPSTGTYHYTRVVDVDAATADAIHAGQAVIVVHGIDYNRNGAYDDVLGKSDLDPSLPAEATDPALCGVLAASQMSSVPSGGAATGGGSTSGTEDTGLLALGGTAIAVAGGALAYRRRVAATQR
jgi:hypothetical protein